MLKSRSALVIAALSIALLSLPILWPHDRLRTWYRDGRPRELRELVDAMATEPTRPIEGRLAGGFVYAPIRPESRGPSGRDLSPDIRIAAARLDKLAQDNDLVALRQDQAAAEAWATFRKLAESPAWQSEAEDRESEARARAGLQGRGKTAASNLFSSCYLARHMKASAIWCLATRATSSSTA